MTWLLQMLNETVIDKCELKNTIHVTELQKLENKGFVGGGSGARHANSTTFESPNSKMNKDNSVEYQTIK